MRYVFPFNKQATTPLMLISLTFSYICYPILALIVVRVVCGYMPFLSAYQGMYYSSVAFLFVGIYSIIGTVAMYVSFFRIKLKK